MNKKVQNLCSLLGSSSKIRGLLTSVVHGSGSNLNISVFKSNLLAHLRWVSHKQNISSILKLYWQVYFYNSNIFLFSVPESQQAAPWTWILVWEMTPVLSIQNMMIEKVFMIYYCKILIKHINLYIQIHSAYKKFNQFVSVR